MLPLYKYCREKVSRQNKPQLEAEIYNMNRERKKEPVRETKRKVCGGRKLEQTHQCSRSPPAKTAAVVSLRALHKRLNSDCQY